MDDTANNLAETPELAQSDAPEAQPTEQPETDQSSDDAQDLDTQGADPEFEEVEYEGKRYALPKELKDAILRQSDYTRKTQELAQQREQSTAEIAAEKARIEADRANFRPPRDWWHWTIVCSSSQTWTGRLSASPTPWPRNSSSSSTNN